MTHCNFKVCWSYVNLLLLLLQFILLYLNLGELNFTAGSKKLLPVLIRVIVGLAVVPRVRRRVQE